MSWKGAELSQKKLIDSALCESDEEVEEYINGSQRVRAQNSDETEPDDHCSLDDEIASITEARGAEDIETLVNLFLLEDDEVSVFQICEAEMNVILSGGASPQPPKKKRRFPGFRKVTRKLADIFDLSVYNKRAEEA